MSDFDSEEPTSLSEAASLSPAAASPERSPLAGAVGVVGAAVATAEAGSGAGAARGSSIPRTVSSFNVLESIAELENSIALCAEDPAPALAKASPEQGQLSPPVARSGGTSPLVVAAAPGNPVSPSLGSSLASHSFPSPALAAIPTLPPFPAPRQAPLIPVPVSTTTLAPARVSESTPATTPAPAQPTVPVAASSGVDDKDFEEFAQQRLSRSPSVEIKSIACRRDKSPTSQGSSVSDSLRTTSSSAASTTEATVAISQAATEPFSYLSSTLAKEFSGESPSSATPTSEEVISVCHKEQDTAEMTSPEATAEDIEGGDLTEAVLAGRRNSARALRIIQENTEILQRIIQAQHRRSSVSSEQGHPSDGGGGSPEPLGASATADPAAGPATGPAAGPAAGPPVAATPNNERRASGPRRTASPAVSPANSPPASPPPSPASPGAAAATAERGRRILDDISALCHPTSPENPDPSVASAPIVTNLTSRDAPGVDPTLTPARRPFSPKIAQFLKNFDELLKPPSPPPTPKAPSPVSSPLRDVALNERSSQEERASLSIDKGSSLKNFEEVVRGVSPEPPLARRYTTHFIDALFEPPRTPSPLPTSASATYLSEAALGDARLPPSSPGVAVERVGDTERERGRDVRKIPVRDDERRKTTSYLTEKREVSQSEEHFRKRSTYVGQGSTSPSRPTFSSEDTSTRSTDAIEESKKRPSHSDISSEYRRHLRSPSPSRTVHRLSPSPNRASFGESRATSHPPLTSQNEPSPIRSKEDLDDSYRRSYSPSTKTVRERSPDRSSEEFGGFQSKSFSPSNKDRAENRVNTLNLIQNEINTGLRKSPSITLETPSHIRERSVGGLQTDAETTHSLSRSPASHRSLVETTHSDARHECRGISPARREVKDSLRAEKEEADGDTFEEKTRTSYLPGRVLLSFSDRDVTDTDVGDYRRHSYSPSRKSSEVDASRELSKDYKRHSYSPSHRSGSVDSEIKSRDNFERYGEYHKQPFSPSRRAFSETSEMKSSDSADLSDLHKRGYHPRKLDSNEYDGKNDESYTSMREYRRYHSYSPSRKVNQERADLRVESYGSPYEESRYSDSKKTPTESEMITKHSDAQMDSKSVHYLASESKRVEYSEYQRQQYSPTKKTSLTTDDYIDDYQRRLISPTKSIEPEASDFSYEEYKNQQYSPSEILELERKARLSIDTSDEYRPFSLTKISPTNTNIIDETDTATSKNLQLRRSGSFKSEEHESSRDFHQRQSSSPIRLKSRGSTEYLSDYHRQSYSPSKRADVESKADVTQTYEEDKVLSRSPSKPSKVDRKIADVTDDFQHPFSQGKKVTSEGKLGGCYNVSDDYQKTPYSPSRKSDMRTSDSLTFTDDFQRVSSPSKKTHLEHKRGDPIDVYEDYKSRPYSPSKISLSKSGDSLQAEHLDDYTKTHYSPSKRSSDVKFLDALETSEGYSRGSYSSLSGTAESEPDHFEYRRRSKSPAKKTHLEGTEEGFGDYHRSSRASSTDITKGDGGAYGDYRRRSESPSRKWQDELGSNADAFSRSDVVVENRGRLPPSAEVGRVGQGQVRQRESPTRISSSAFSGERASALSSVSADASAPTPTSTSDAEQAAPPQQQLPEEAWRPSLQGPPVSSTVVRATPASASGTAGRRRRGACDSEDAAPPPPPRSGSGSGGSRASSASPRRRRRPSDTELLAGYRGTDLPPYVSCCPPFVASPLSEAALSQVARGVDGGSSLPPQPRARPASPIIGATLEECMPPPPTLPGRRSSAASIMPLTGTSSSPPLSPHFHASFHTKPCGGKAFAASASSAFSRYSHRGRERPTSLLLDGGGAAAAVAAFDAAPLYKSLSMLSLGEGDIDRPDICSRQKKKTSDGKRSPRRRRTSSDLSSELSSSVGSSTQTSTPAPAPKDLCANLPPLRPAGSSPMPASSPAKSPGVFSPFPTRASMRQPKELGVRLGLYTRDTEKST